MATETELVTLSNTDWLIVLSIPRQSSLLHLCTGDVVIARAAVERYEDQHPAFEGSRENLLIKRLIDATEENDLVAFDAAVKQYEKITKMTEWTEAHVKTIRKALQDDEVDLK